MINFSVFMSAACSHWTEWFVFVVYTATPLLVSLANRLYVFHQPCLEGATCLPNVERPTFTRDTVDNTLQNMVEWVFRE